MATKKRGKPRRAEYHHGDLRRAVLVEASVLVEKGGPEAVSLREIARRLGVSYGAPHHHFAEKDDLFAALATDAFEALEMAIGKRLARVVGAGPALLLRAVAETYLDFATRHRALYEVMEPRNREHLDSAVLFCAAIARYTTRVVS